MRLILIIVTTVIIIMNSSCYAGCNCDDWVTRGGYCVDYVKSRIPSFPTPKNITEIVNLKNKEITKITEGDVAMFNYSNYWHVTYIEKVHIDKHGNATAIDVSEMNFGGQISLDEYQNKWSPKNKSELDRAICCGVTNKYNQISLRKNVALNTVKQIWSPVSTVYEGIRGERDETVFDKVREVLNRFFQLTGREL